METITKSTNATEVNRAIQALGKKGTKRGPVANKTKKGNSAKLPKPTRKPTNKKKTSKTKGTTSVLEGLSVVGHKSVPSKSKDPVKAPTVDKPVAKKAESPEVVKATATARNLDLMKDINKGMLLHYQDGDFFRGRRCCNDQGKLFPGSCCDKGVINVNIYDQVAKDCAASGMDLVYLKYMDSLLHSDKDELGSWAYKALHCK